MEFFPHGRDSPIFVDTKIGTVPRVRPIFVATKIGTVPGAPRDRPFHATLPEAGRKCKEKRRGTPVAARPFMARWQPGRPADRAAETWHAGRPAAAAPPISSERGVTSTSSRPYYGRHETLQRTCPSGLGPTCVRLPGIAPGPGGDGQFPRRRNLPARSTRTSAAATSSSSSPPARRSTKTSWNC